MVIYLAVWHRSNGRCAPVIKNHLTLT